MTHTAKDGSSKVVPECTLPLTSAAAVDVLITDIAKFRYLDGRLTLVGLIGGATLEEVAAKTEATYDVALDKL
jgi:3-oxoacid CoA-transferase